MMKKSSSVAFSLLIGTTLLVGCSPASNKINESQKSTSSSKMIQDGKKPRTRSQVMNIEKSNYSNIAIIQSKIDKNVFGTGSFISPDTLLTNRHVVMEQDANVHVVRVIDKDGKPIELPIKSFIIPEDESMDVGIVKLKESIDTNDKLSHIKMLTLAEKSISEKTKKGDFVRTVGYPGDKEYGTLWDSQGNITELEGNFISFNAPIAGGSSGSPIFNKIDQVIGLSNASSDDIKNPKTFGFLFNSEILAFINKYK